MDTIGEDKTTRPGRYALAAISVFAFCAGPSVRNCCATPPTPLEQHVSRLPPDLLAVPEAQSAPLAGLAEGSREAQERQKKVVTELGGALEVKTRKTGIAFRLVPAGTFMMGSPMSERKACVKAGLDCGNETQRRVTLTRAFCCGKYEVTQRQWEAVMGGNPSAFEESGKDAPVEMASWRDCQKFCRKLCRLEGVPEGAYRLLTEAEWEYACRAGTETPFCYGYDLGSTMANFDGGHPFGNSRKGVNRSRTVSVGPFKPNAWGLYDMHGNVWEWCQDWFGDYPSGSATDPAGAKRGSVRVMRGGSWRNDALLCRSAFRAGCSPGLGISYLGLRLARSVSAAGD